MKKQALKNTLKSRSKTKKCAQPKLFLRIKGQPQKMASHRALTVACRVIAIFFLFSALCSSAFVKSSAYSDKEYSLIDEEAQGILEDFKGILPDGMDSLADPGESLDKVGVKFLIECALESANDSGADIISFFMLWLGFTILSSFASLKGGEHAKATQGAISIVLSALIVDTVFDLVGETGEALQSINGFYSSLIPIVGAVNLFGLSSAVASAESAGMTLTLGIYSFFSGGFLYSFVGSLSVLAALSVIDGGSFGRIAQGVKKAFLWTMGLLSTFIGATFSLQTLISSYTDSGVLRGAKYAVSGMIPIVGGSISGALSVLISGFSYLKGTVGAGAIAVIVSLTVAPLVTLFLYRMSFALAIFVSDVFSQNGAGGLLSAFAFALDALIAVYSLTSLIYIIQLVVFMKGGGSVV
jgi:stage III sporulation protein AE